MPPQPAPHPGAPSIHRLVPFVYVAEIPRTLAFYALLGFECLEIMHDRHATPFWAWAQTRPGGSRGVVAQIMFNRAWRPVVPDGQDIMFYLYTLDLTGLRRHLLAHGVADGGHASNWEVPPGQPRATRTLFETTYPPYMPAGEFRVHDPDGYCLLVGQLDEPVHA